MRRKLLKHERLYLPAALLCVFAASYMMAYEMAQKSWTDLAVHVEIANAFLDGVEKNANPGFYLVFGFLTRVCGIPQIHGAACAMGMFFVLTGVAVYVISGFALGWNIPERIRCLIVLFISFFGPLYLGGESYYLGPGSFNAWHNPTNSGVKFFALICFFLFMYVDRMKNEDSLVVCGRKIRRVHLYMLLVALTCCSLVFKPSFFQVFAPTLAVIYGVDFLLKRRGFKNCVADAMLFLPAIALIVYQMFAEIGGEESGGGMFIAFALGWSFHTDNVLRAIMANAIFILFVCVFCEKNLFSNKMLLYSVLFYVIGVGEGLFLCESGPRISHGNLLWGNEIGIGVGYLGAVLCFVQYMHRTKENPTAGQKAVRYTGNALLAAQFLLGVWYVLRCIILELEYF